jgi:hypothetical protein
MARGGRVPIGRLSIYEESALATASLGTIQHLGGLTDAAYELTEDSFEDTSQRDDRNAKRAPWKGEGKNTLSFKIPLSKQLVPQAGSIFKSALGTESPAQAMTITLASTTTTQFTYSAGEPDNWVIVTHTSGRFSYRPVVRKAGGVADFAFQLPTVSGGISAITNARNFGAATGRGYVETPGASMLSLGAQADQHNEPDQTKATLTALVPTSILYEMQPNQRKFMTIGMEGRGWTDGSAANVAAANKPIKHSPSWQTDCYLLTDYDAPGATPAVTKIISYKMQIAPKQNPHDTSQARSGATEGTLPQFSLSEWRRDDPMQDDLEIVIAYYDETHNTNFKNEAQYQIAIIDYLGNPGSSSFAGDAVCMYWPKAQLKVKPKRVPVNGVWGMSLIFHCADERDIGNSAGQMSSALITKLAFSEFIS